MPDPFRNIFIFLWGGGRNVEFKIKLPTAGMWERDNAQLNPNVPVLYASLDITRALPRSDGLLRSWHEICPIRYSASPGIG